MIRARFKCNDQDPRPVVWPIKHPYWVTGYGDNSPMRRASQEGDGYAVIVAYADDEDEIKKNWPDAFDITSEPADKYNFNSRFQKPEWFNEMDN